MQVWDVGFERVWCGISNQLNMYLQKMKRETGQEIQTILNDVNKINETTIIFVS